MKVHLCITLVISVLLIHSGCIYSQQLSQPERNFEFLWKTYDRDYALFEAKNVDWNALYKIYRPQVTANTSDKMLFEIMSSMLGHLNDNHVRLWNNNHRFSAGLLNDMEMVDFSLDLVKTKYLNNKFKSLINDRFQYGWLNDKIGYFHFSGFGNISASTAAIDEIVEALKDAKALVIDIRQNGGGDDRVGKLIADRFADQKRLYMTTAMRRDESHSDFAPPKYWYAEPNGSRQFTKPITLLTHRFSISAADNFALAMRVLPHVTIIGDFTSGCFADASSRQLPNGWGFSVSINLFKDQNDFCWEGIGVPPDLMIRNSKEDIESGTDKVLEFAITFLESAAAK